MIKANFMWQLNFVGRCSSVHGAQFFPLNHLVGGLNVGNRFKVDSAENTADSTS